MGGLEGNGNERDDEQKLGLVKGRERQGMFKDCVCVHHVRGKTPQSRMRRHGNALRSARDHQNNLYTPPRP